MESSQYSNKGNHVETQIKEGGSLQTVAVIEETMFKIGYGYFTPQIKKKDYLRLFNGVVIDLLQKEVWKFRNLNQTKRERWGNIFNVMIKCDATKFAYALKPNPNILKQIEAIQFPNLRELNLFSASILNYQSFAFIQAPILQGLNLIWNNCSNLKSFNKMHLPTLKILCLYIKDDREFGLHNQINHQYLSFQSFERWGFNLNELRLQKMAYDIVCLNDLSKLAKAKPSLQNVHICRSLRIDQMKVMKCLSKKSNMKFHAFDRDHNQFRPIQFQLEHDSQNENLY